MWNSSVLTGSEPAAVLGGFQNKAPNGCFGEKKKKRDHNKQTLGLFSSAFEIGARLLYNSSTGCELCVLPSHSSSGAAMIRAILGACSAGIACDKASFVSSEELQLGSSPHPPALLFPAASRPGTCRAPRKSKLRSARGARWRGLISWNETWLWV